MPVFYINASIDSGNRNINNFLPVRCNEGRFVASVHYVQSLSHNIYLNRDSPLLLIFVLPQEVL